MVCRRCHDFGDGGQLLEQIQAYVAAIPKDMACDEAIYDRRLRVCEGCDKLRNGMCAYCGCFVVVRAKKLKMTCPSPEGNRWLKEET